MPHRFIVNGGGRTGWRLAAAAAVLASVACGEDDASPLSNGGAAGSAGAGGDVGSDAGGGSSGLGIGGTGGSSGDGGAGGVGGAPMRALPAEYQPGPVEGRPLLDASPDRAPCAVTREPALLGTDVGVLFRNGDSGWFAYADNSRGTGMTEAGIGLAPLVNGALGSEIFTVPELTRIPQLQAVFDGERITLVWRRDRPEPTSPFGAVSELGLAQLDASGTPVTPARAIVGGSPAEQYEGRLVPTAQGFVLFWVQAPQNATPYQARVARLAPDGALVGEPRVLIEQDTYLLTTSLTRLGDRVVATYEGGEGYTSVILDEQAQSLGGAVPIGQAHWSAVLPRGERVLSAWTVTHELPPTEASTVGGALVNPSKALTLRVGWFDRDGKAVGTSRDLQAPVPDEENVDPAWVDLGGDVGLLWSQGSVIYLCGGCMPDNHLQLVVLDGETLEPKTQVLRLDNPASQGGLIRPQILAAGSDQLIVGEVGYHTDAEAMTATVRCVQ